MKFRTNNGTEGAMFKVPNIVADNLLKLVGGEEIKVLLYILRNSGADIKAEEISANTGVPQQQIQDAIDFWHQYNLILYDTPPQESQTVNNNNIMVPPEPVKIQTDNIPDNDFLQQNTQKPVSPVSTKACLKPSLMNEEARNNPDIIELFQIIQGIIINPNHIMRNSLIWIHEYLGLKTEVIVTLVNYCATIDCINSGYIEKIAVDWSDKGINTLEMAQNEVDRLIKSRSCTGQIIKMFDMKRNPTTSQQEFIDKWLESGYSMEMIKYAYELTIEQIEKLSFPYINKILVSWEEKGFKTTDDVKKSASERKKNYKPKNSANSDGFDADKYDIVVNNF